MNWSQILGRDHRTVLIRKNILASFVIKAWQCVVMFLSVRLTLFCLGEYKNGVWLTISSFLIYIDNFDIGLGNGLRNKLATYLAHDDYDNARKAVSSTFLMLIFIIIPVTFLLILLSYYVDVYHLLNVDKAIESNLVSVLIVTIILVCSTFVFKFIGNFYLGLQLPAVSNFLITCGNTLALLGTYIAYISHNHSLMTIAIINTGCPLLVYLLAYPYTFGCRYKELRPSIACFDKKMIGNLMSISIQFFFMQICSSLIFVVSNIMISRWFTPALVTPYQTAYRYFSMVLIIFTVICAPFWTATTDAFERGDMNWIKQAEKKIKVLLVAITALMIFMLLISNYVYPIWIGQETHVPFHLSAVMAVYMLIVIYSTAYCYFLNGIGILRLQLIFTVVGAILFFILAQTLVKHSYDITSIVITMAIITLPNMICNKIQFKKIINKTAKGIWAK